MSEVNGGALVAKTMKRPGSPRRFSVRSIRGWLRVCMS